MFLTENLGFDALLNCTFRTVHQNVQNERVEASQSKCPERKRVHVCCFSDSLEIVHHLFLSCPSTQII
jgi:hypothetical protein